MKGEMGISGNPVFIKMINEYNIDNVGRMPKPTGMTKHDEHFTSRIVLQGDNVCCLNGGQRLGWRWIFRAINLYK